jgi:signal transduction histidine kinase
MTLSASGADYGSGTAMSTILRDAFSVTRLSFWTGVLLSTLVGSMAYLATVRSIESDAKQRFINNTRYAQSDINVRIKQYTNLLRSTASMIQSTPTFTQRRFDEYVHGLVLQRNFPAIDNINYALAVREDERPAFMKELGQEMRRVLGERAEPIIMPRGRRPSYLVITYIEPAAQATQFFGLDLMAKPYFIQQLREERDQGKIVSSGVPMPFLSRPNAVRIGLRMPVYDTGMPLTTVEERRQAYQGSLGMALSIPMLLRGVSDKIPIPGVRLTLYDVGGGIDPLDHGPAGHPVTLFDTLGTARDPTPPLATGDDVFSVTLPLEFNGRPWKTVYSVRKSALYTEFDSDYPKLMMLFGFVGSMLLYALLHTLTSSRRAALELAQEMTSELRESQNKLQLSHQKLRRLADHAYQIKEFERKRIAREIHDDLGQNLLALRIETEMFSSRTRGSHSHLHARARATLQQIDIVIKSVRQIINDLRPTVLDLGLSAAVEWQVNQFQRRTGIACEVRDEHGEIPLPDHCATAFFRILQESLTNVVRHAKATHVVVELRLNAGWLSMTVKDNGCGLPPGGRNKFGSFGLVGIEERIVILGGTCAVFSETGGGTTVMVSAPVADTPAHLLQGEEEHSIGSAVI